MKVFISYRRQINDIYAGRLSDRIMNHFGDEVTVFVDIDSIAPGEDFVKVIENAVATCDVMVAVIGKEWLTVTDDKGNRRLDNPEDFVRLEIAAALKRDIRVIPVLVQGASMPTAEDLPDDLKLLKRRNAVSISNERWNFDSDRMIKAIEDEIGPKQKRGEFFDHLISGLFSAWKIILVGIGSIILLGIVWILWATRPVAVDLNRNTNGLVNTLLNNSLNGVVITYPKNYIVTLNSEAKLYGTSDTSSTIQSLLSKGSRVRLLSSKENWHFVEVIENPSYGVNRPSNYSPTPGPGNSNPGDRGWLFYFFREDSNLANSALVNTN